MKKKRPAIKLDKLKALFLKKSTKSTNKKKISNSIKIKLNDLNNSKIKLTKLYFGKEIKSNRSLNNNNSPLNSLKLYDDLENNTLYSSYADPINFKASLYESQRIYNDVNLLSFTDKGKNPIISNNNFSTRFTKTLREKVKLSVDKWIQTLNDSKKSFITKHYNLPLISSIEFNHSIND